MNFTRFTLFRALPLLLIGLFSACGNEPQPVRSTGNLSMMNDSMMNYNKAVVRTESQEITDFIARYGWNMVTTLTGLRYMIYRHGSGEKAMAGKKATVNYEVRLISGDLCYTSAKSGPKVIIIGHSEVESGVAEGILLMHVGDRAKFIVPSHLAFGLLGDQDKIPPKSTLVYDIELIKLN